MKLITMTSPELVTFDGRPEMGDLVMGSYVSDSPAAAERPATQRVSVRRRRGRVEESLLRSAVKCYSRHASLA
jgi:hypothetical protein